MDLPGPPTAPAVVPTEVAVALPTVELILPNVDALPSLSPGVGEVGVVGQIEEIRTERQAGRSPQMGKLFNAVASQLNNPGP